MRFICAAAAVLIVAADVGSADDKRAEDLKKLQGKWVPISVEFSGKPEPEKEWIQKAWEFNDSEAQVTVAGSDVLPDAVLKYELQIDPNKNPAEMDLKTKNPKLGFIAIYKFDGDNLIICWSAGRESRPDKFETSKKDFYFLTKFKRSK